ncbi:hypothetical protein CDAR_283651 [Caerostris darwini]|uniref:Uncharacterized protein n=1 Tax=Caerostris darwini TaxID=1538125 RepID=A0AAV4TS19_9ARAC|nr:hypothetical protein CDAR_283651 [Caerostris darwini]
MFNTLLPKLELLSASNTSIPGIENRLPRCLFFTYGNKNHWVPEQGCTVDDPSVRYFEQSNIELFGLVYESRVVITRNNPVLSLVFSYFSKDFW